jgi:hypothetical protein
MPSTSNRYTWRRGHASRLRAQATPDADTETLRSGSKAGLHHALQDAVPADEGVKQRGAKVRDKYGK